MRKRGLIVLLALLTKFAGASIIYQDDFSGSRDDRLHGAAPDVRPGSEVWATDNRNFDYSWKADGWVNASNATANSSAALPFTLESGMIYQLTAEFTMGAIDTANTAWCGISFCTRGDELEYAPDRNSFLRFYAQLNGDVTAVSDSGTKRQRLYTGGDVTLSIILNTIGTDWSVQYFFNDTLYESKTITAAATAGTELYIKFGHYRQVGEATINNFTFEAIPEPSSVTLFLISSMGFVCFRRRNLR